jgi:hypothetical protein
MWRVHEKLAALLATVVLGYLLGCASEPRPRPSQAESQTEGQSQAQDQAQNPARNPDAALVAGLHRIDAPLPGVLLVKNDHHMGSYDKLMVDPVLIMYERRADRLKESEAEKLAAYLREATSRELVNIDPSQLVSEAGPCVLRMQTAFVDLDLPDVPTPPDARTTVMTSYGSVSLVHLLRDSQTGEVLLQYRGRIRAEGGRVIGGAKGWRRMTRTLDRMLYELQSNLIAAVPPSVATSGPLSQCGGQIYQTIQAIRPKVTKTVAR